MDSILEVVRTPARTVNGAQLVFLGVLSSVLVNIVVLNLFVEFSDKVIIDSFTISIFTAVLLTALLFVITRFEHRISHFFFEQHTGRAWRFAGVVAVWAVLFGSKFLILEAVDLVFGDHVELGKLIEVILIVVVMLASKALVAWVFDWLGTRGSAPTPA
jgi:hypothetical protein